MSSFSWNSAKAVLLAASSTERVGCMQEGRYRSGIGSDAVMMAVPVALIGEGVQLALTHLIQLPGKFDVCRDVQVFRLEACTQEASLYKQGFSSSCWCQSRCAVDAVCHCSKAETQCMQDFIVNTWCRECITPGMIHKVPCFHQQLSNLGPEEDGLFTLRACKNVCCLLT